jgi:hypothetical protein
MDRRNDVESANTTVASPKQATLTSMIRPTRRESGHVVITAMTAGAPDRRRRGAISFGLIPGPHLD